jgi:hypothetical protein
MVAYGCLFGTSLVTSLEKNLAFLDSNQTCDKSMVLSGGVLWIWRNVRVGADMV